MKQKRSHLKQTCPYFKWEGEYSVHCRCGVFNFPNRVEMLEYEKKYCAASPMGFENCTMCKMAQDYYFKKNGEEGHEQNKSFK